MTIVALKKLTLFGLSSDKEQMLEVLQELGCAHLIELRQQDNSDDEADSSYRKKVLAALNILAQCPVQNAQAADAQGFDLTEMVDRTLQIQCRIGELRKYREVLIERIERLKPWGDFRFPDAEALQGLKFWFYCVPEAKLPELTRSDAVWQCVLENHGIYYVVVIDRDEPLPSSMPVPRTHVGGVSLSQLTREVNELESSLLNLEKERQLLTQWSAWIAGCLASIEDRQGRRFAESISIENDGIFIIQGWIPAALVRHVECRSRQYSWALLWSDPELGDHPPTLLDNPESLAGGQELIKIYYPPDYFGWDPSTVMFFSFAAFFSIILSDAGYAALLSMLLASFWRNLDKTRLGRRLRRLAAVTFGMAFLWGVALGSYFGVSPPAGSPMTSLVLVHASDMNAMMILSMGVGTAHVAIANLVLCYHQRRRPVALAYLGWMFVAIGGFLWWYAVFATNRSPPYGPVALVCFGILMILFFGSERVIAGPADFAMRIVDGVINLTKLSQLLGDVMSYLRLFALGLSSASMAVVFNRLAEQVFTSMQSVGWLLALLILLLGHGLNLLLCLMSGIVHGLRLNFIEFYRWGVTDEGHAFQAFAKKEKRHD